MAEVNQNVTDNSDDKAVKDALKVISDDFSTRNKQDGIIDAIKSLFKEGFTVSDPKGTRQLSSQLLYQALWRTISRTKPLDFMLHASGRPQEVEQIVTAGVSTIMDKGGYDSVLRDKNGVFWSQYMFGDGIMQIGTNDDKKSKIPITFDFVANKNVYTDQFCTGIRVPGKGRSATKMVVIHSYSWEEFIQLYPKLKNKAGVGRIDRGNSGWKDQLRTFEQEANMENLIEVAYSYDLSTKTFVTFAGSGATIIDKFTNEDYPFVKDDEAYIPLTQWVCIPSDEGFWNYGIGHLLYKLAIISRGLMNMELKHIQNNTLPIELISLPQSTASKFFNRLKYANEMIANGQRGFLPIERQAGDPNGSSVTSSSLISPNLFNEWQAVYDRLIQEIRRLGINLDEIDAGKANTATEIIANEENSNAFVKQVMEWNASETQHTVEVTLDMTAEFITKKNKTPINMTTMINTNEGTFRADGVTLGMVAEEIKEHNYFVKVNSRTGAIPSNVLMQAKIGQVLPFAQPGSKAYNKLVSQMANINDVDIPGEEFMVQQQQMAAPEAPEEIASGTDRLTINPRVDQQVPVI